MLSEIFRFVSPVTYLLICSAAFLTSGLTLFSGFGLGTLLLPVFGLFFTLPVAVGLTAIVHFLNNLFKLALLGKHADRSVVLRFGLPALFASILGAQFLVWLSSLPPVAQYYAFGRFVRVLPVNLVVALMMAVFGLMEFWAPSEKASVEKKYLPLGGILSGFIGGLSGHQGALRSAFLIRCGLTKEAYIASGVVIACLVDIARISVYASKFSAADLGANASLLVAATLSAFLGAWLGNRFIGKVTLRAVSILVAVMLILFAIGLGSGLI